MESGTILDRPLSLRLKKALATRLSPSHVPAVIVQVDEVPTTFSGKQSERAARDALAGQLVANLSALRNPRSLDAIRDHPALRLNDSLAG
jgi:acetoacetyl-CoA synthetase